MEKRDKWTISPASAGRAAVVYRLENGQAGDAIILLPTEDEAWYFIDSGQADGLERKRRK
jgi:hypothetical protein